MKQVRSIGIVAFTMLVFVIVLAGCTAPQNAAVNPTTVPAVNPVTSSNVPAPAITSPSRTSTPAPLPAYSPKELPNASRIETGFQNSPGGALDRNQVTDIDYLERVQKLDSDLYAAIAAHYPDSTLFSDLALSSDTMANADDVIYVRYRITDPESDTPGVFTDPVFQRIYDDDIAAMSKNIGSALMTAAQNEDMHISNISAVMARTDNKDLTFMYAQQMREARNNLRLINAQLTAMGTPYTPVYLSPELYAAIVYSNTEWVSVP